MPTWKKKLSVTDAQQKTKGRLVPYLRMTKSSLENDSRTWFRNTMFGALNWKPGSFGKETNLQVAHVNMAVSINGQPFGNLKVMLTYGPNRSQNNSTPTTWIHWPDSVQNHLQKNNLTGYWAQVERDASGNFSLAIFP